MVTECDGNKQVVHTCNLEFALLSNDKSFRTHFTSSPQDGRSSGLTAPNGPSQAALQRSTLLEASVPPECVSLISLHGTGTPLGDPIEVGALGQGFAGKRCKGLQMSTSMAITYFVTMPQSWKQSMLLRKQLWPSCSLSAERSAERHNCIAIKDSFAARNRCQLPHQDDLKEPKMRWLHFTAGKARQTPMGIVSNKSCFGHTEGAAGLTGMLLAVESCAARAMAPVMHLRNCNPHVATALESWQAKSMFTASVPLQATGETSSLL